MLKHITSKYECIICVFKATIFFQVIMYYIKMMLQISVQQSKKLYSLNYNSLPSTLCNGICTMKEGSIFPVYKYFFHAC